VYKEWRPTDFIIECIIKHMLLVACEQHKRAGLLHGRVPAQKVDGISARPQEEGSFEAEAKLLADDHRVLQGPGARAVREPKTLKANVKIACGEVGRQQELVLLDQTLSGESHTAAGLLVSSPLAVCCAITGVESGDTRGFFAKLVCVASKLVFFTSRAFRRMFVSKIGAVSLAVTEELRAKELG